MGVTECMAAVEAIRSLCDTPILCTLSVYSDGKCYFDGSAEEAAEILPGLGADAVGLNCSSGPDQIGTVVRMMKKAAPDTPIAAKPNAGLPTITETGEAVYHMDPEDFARHMRALKQDGASLLGGCCGTGPAYIEALPRAALSLIRPAFRADSPAPAQVEVQAQSRTPRRASPRPCASCAAQSS